MKLNRLFLTVFALAALLLAAGSASAQDIDLGKDGIDMNCEDFPERNAAEGYFAHDGGSAERNADGLDTDGDGIPCNEADYDGEEPEYVPPVVGDEPQTDPEPGNDGDGSYVPPVVGDEPKTDPVPAAVTSLPSTGAGDASLAAASGTSIAALLAGFAALLTSAALAFRRSSH